MQVGVVDTFVGVAEELGSGASHRLPHGVVNRDNLAGVLARRGNLAIVYPYHGVTVAGDEHVPLDVGCLHDAGWPGRAQFVAGQRVGGDPHLGQIAQCRGR